MASNNSNNIMKKKKKKIIKCTNILKKYWSLVEKMSCNVVEKWPIYSNYLKVAKRNGVFMKMKYNCLLMKI